MTQLDRQIRKTQRRLWLNRGFAYLSLSLGVAAGVFAAVVLIQRLFDFAIPLFWSGVGLGGAALLATMVAIVYRHEDAALAAARLDEAAGLKERMSSGHYCQDSDDPFAAAVVADAERVSGSVSVRRHIRLRAPNSLALSIGAIIVAALMFLITPGMLKPTDAKGSEQQQAEAQQAKVAVERKFEAIRKMTESVPALEELKDELDGMDKQAGGQLQRPGDIRHEAVKKIDHLADAVKQKRDSAQYDSVGETRKMLRQLKAPQSTEAPTQKLTSALAKGDFQSAKEEIQALKEQLATLKTEQDKEVAARLSQQLDDLAKQLEELAKNKDLAQKLEQAGVKKEDLDRMLENLSKKDLDQLRKQLEKKGFNQNQIDQLAKQLQQKQQAGAAAKGLSKSLQQAAQCKNSEQMGEAIAGLSQAADQLSDLETLEQEMTQLDSTLDSLQEARNDLDKPCSQCGGTGCGQCGGGMGRQLAQGRGGLAPEQQTDVDFKVERAQVHTGKGAIIGQFYFDGEQVKGEVSSDLAEVFSAAEREASDRISRDRVPRQYQKAVKAYFSNVQRSIQEAKPTEPKNKNDNSANESTGDERDKSTTDENRD